jgi:hypothetical protein
MILDLPFGMRNCSLATPLCVGIVITAMRSAHMGGAAYESLDNDLQHITLLPLNSGTVELLAVVARHAVGR